MRSTEPHCFKSSHLIRFAFVNKGGVLLGELMFGSVLAPVDSPIPFRIAIRFRCPPVSHKSPIRCFVRS